MTKPVHVKPVHDSKTSAQSELVSAVHVKKLCLANHCVKIKDSAFTQLNVVLEFYCVSKEESKANIRNRYN